MATRRPTAPAVSDTTQKLRQTQAEYVAARPAGEPGVKPMMSSSKMYVCRRCQANFKTGDGKPDPRLPGLGKCNKPAARTHQQMSGHAAPQFVLAHEDLADAATADYRELSGRQRLASAYRQIGRSADRPASRRVDPATIG